MDRVLKPLSWCKRDSDTEPSLPSKWADLPQSHKNLIIWKSSTIGQNFISTAVTEIDEIGQVSFPDVHEHDVEVGVLEDHLKATFVVKMRQITQLAALNE